VNFVPVNKQGGKMKKGVLSCLLQVFLSWAQQTKQWAGTTAKFFYTDQAVRAIPRKRAWK